ncbi:MAG: hypothetical protein ACRDKW_18940 [Actinomycetota bacterium]
MDPWNWSVEFAKELFAPTGYWGLSLGVVVATGCTVAALAAGRIRQQRVVVCGLAAAAALTVMARLHVRGLLPRELMSIEPSRWMPMAGALLAMASAPLGDAIASGLRRRAGPGARKPVVVGCTILLVGGMGAASVEGAAWYRQATFPLGDELGFGDEFAEWASTQPDLAPGEMVWALPNDVAYTSYFAFGRVQFPGDYIVTRQWTIASPPLVHALKGYGPGSPATTGDFAPAERFLRMYGVRYLILRESEPANVSLVTGPLAGRLGIVARIDGGWIAEVPWEPVRAFAAPLDAVRPTTVPDLEFLEYDEVVERDRLIDAYNAVKHSAAATPASMTWHSPTRLTVELDARPGDTVVVPQNWDTVWTAEAEGRALRLERAGPNFFAVDLGGRSGPVSIELEHGPYARWTASFWMIAGGLGLAAVAFLFEARAGERPPPRRRRAPGGRPAGVTVSGCGGGRSR